MAARHDYSWPHPRPDYYLELGEACFYYPDLDSEGAARILTDAPIGTFLVRANPTPFPFILTVKTSWGAESISISSTFMGLLRLLEADVHRLLRKHLLNKGLRTGWDVPKTCFHFAAVIFGDTTWIVPQFKTLLELLDYHVTECQRGEDLQGSAGLARTILNLTTPRRHSVPSLTHLARVTVNRHLRQPSAFAAYIVPLLPVPDYIKNKYITTTDTTTTDTTTTTTSSSSSSRSPLSLDQLATVVIKRTLLHPTYYLPVPQLVKNYLDSYPFRV